METVKAFMGPFEMSRRGVVIKIYVNFHYAKALFNLIVFMILQLTLTSMLTIFTSIAILLVYLCIASVVNFK